MHLNRPGLDLNSNSTEPTKTPSHQPKGFGQFRISTLISWMAVITIVLVWSDASAIVRSIDPNLSGAELGSRLAEGLQMAIVFGLFIFPALTCVPMLIDKLLYREKEFGFGGFSTIWLTLALPAYSSLSLMLATVGFNADWKGAKGRSWTYYLLDDWAGLTLWPIYILGAILVSCGLWNRQLAKASPIVLLAVLTNAAISFWYVGAVFFLNFTIHEPSLAIVPGSCGACYAIYAVLLWRHREYETPLLAKFKAQILGWATLLLASIALKIPLAKRYYDSLPDEMPEGCFVVTAATQGHQQIVNSWFDDSQARILNQQLLTFWSFENRLRETCPRFHRWLRAFYNRIGPIVARQIRFRWQADLMYWLLKPLEWLAGWYLKS